MNTEEAIALQTKMTEAGLYSGKIDGIWGPKSQAAYEAYTANLGDTSNLDIAWSAKVSPEFIQRVKDICVKLKMDVNGPDYLMSCMAWETGETFSPTIKNAAGAPYYGLIQFGEAACTDIGITLDQILKLTAEEQLEYVYKFFKPYAGKLFTVSDIYSRIIWPRAVGKPEDYVIFSKDAAGKAYLQNKGVDLNKDGYVTKAEAAECVMKKYKKGMLPANRRVLA